MNTIPERITALRSEMEKHHIDIYIVPTADFHGSEYVGDHFKCRAFLTGFTGSAGTAVFTQTEAGLWTDGRYFVQADKELEGSGVTLYRAGTEGTPSVREYLKEKADARAGLVLGFDGRCIPSKTAEEYETLIKEYNGSIRTDLDLADRVWTDRPPLPMEPVWVLDAAACGETTNAKLSRIREEMKEAHADMHVVSTLYDIAWILNIRGGDISHVPVPLAFLFLTQQHADLFIEEAKLSEEVIRYLTACGVRVFAYDTVYESAASIPQNTSVMLDPACVNDRLVRAFPEKTRLIRKADPSVLMRAVKNPREIVQTKQAHIRDGVAVTKFIYWLKKQIGTEPITEYSAACKIDGLRAEQDQYLDLSFDTISAYGPNAAMMHYQAKEDASAELKPAGMLLVDSGGHYLDGTTDITRTIILGEITQAQREAYTRVLIGNLHLSDVKFLAGCSGYSLDILAREKLWEIGIDYRCGTGHGVGHLLNVHEGPNAFRWKRGNTTGPDDTLQPGMITTNEPGVYVDGEYGIRLENELLCVTAEKNEYGQFLAFEPLTFCPFDPAGIELSLMSTDDIRRLNAYHALVYDTIAPLLSEEEREWLYETTRPLSR